MSQETGPVLLGINRASQLAVVTHKEYSLLHSSAATSSSSANYDRPNRLKGREDGGIRWVELLEKFRSVQERARRVQRHNMEGEDVSTSGLGDIRMIDGPSELKAGNRAPGPVIAPSASKDATPAPPAKKSGLGRQFGRLGGAVSGKSKRN